MPSHDAASPRQPLRKTWGATTPPSGMNRDHRPHAAQQEVVSCLFPYAVAALRDSGGAGAADRPADVAADPARIAAVAACARSGD